MINLNHKRNLEEIAVEYYAQVKKWLLETPTTSKGVSYTNMLDKARSNADISLKSMIDFYEEKFDRIILSKPSEHMDLLSEFETTFRKEQEEYNKLVAEKVAKEMIKDCCWMAFTDMMTNFYSQYTGKYGYPLAKRLNIRVCPYCNRQYTFTIDENVRVRPEFDHFYPKSKYPLLAISFYNLIPSCPNCNHTKGTKEIKVHPYLEGFSETSCFMAVSKDKKEGDTSNILLIEADQLVLEIENATDEEQSNMKVFGLMEMYNQHLDYVSEIMDKTQAYNVHAREALVNSYQGAGNNPQQVYEFVWGRYLDDAEHENRPLAKLTKDMLEQFGIRKI